MAIDVEQRAGGVILVVQLTGEVTREECDLFIPEVRLLSSKYGAIRLLLDARDLLGWESGMPWRGLEYDLKHASDLERLAIVGTTKQPEAMKKLAKPLAADHVRYFGQDQVEQARAWVEQPPREALYCVVERPYQDR